uniref:Death domain-containing protein n=1 Tax=Amphimedon queenslandica TaxID=400682 RepID=A0A1X7UER7_AMPQE
MFVSYLYFYIETITQNDKPATNYSPTQISESNDDQQKVILTIRDLVDIVRVLKDCKFQTIKWFDLGLYLGLIHNDLKVIETNYPRDTEQCLRECLAKWLTDDIEATWDKLAIAVGEVKETTVAEYIKEQYVRD